MRKSFRIYGLGMVQAQSFSGVGRGNSSHGLGGTRRSQKARRTLTLQLVAVPSFCLGRALGPFCGGFSTHTSFVGSVSRLRSDRSFSFNAVGDQIGRKRKYPVGPNPVFWLFGIGARTSSSRPSFFFYCFPSCSLGAITVSGLIRDRPPALEGNASWGYMCVCVCVCLQLVHHSRHTTKCPSNRHL